MTELAPSPIGHRAVAKMSAGAPIVGIVPTTIDDAFRLAQLIYSSKLAPYQLKTPEAVTVVLLKGLELGLPPMTALETIGVINGKACLFGDGIPALLWSHGFKLKEWYEGEGDKLTAKCTLTRPDGTEITGEFSTQDAKDAGLWDERTTVRRKNKETDEWFDATNDAPWARYRKRMLKMRCRGWTARDGGADVLKGMPIFEEQRDLEASLEEPRDITPRPKAALEIPDLDTDPKPEPAKAAPGPADVPDLEAEAVDDDLADQDGFLAKLREERGFCNSEQDLAELRDGNADMINRLNAANRAKAEAILNGDDE